MPDLWGLGGCGKRCVSRWGHRAAHELSKVIDVSQAKIIWLIFYACRRVEDRSNVRRAQPVRDSHLVEIGIPNKGEQAAVLVLPAEASDPSLSWGFEDWSLHHFPMNSAVALMLRTVGAAVCRLLAGYAGGTAVLLEVSEPGAE